jgi:hypothetical protein
MTFNPGLQAYERSYPVANYSRDTCGIVHIIVGSAGNDEGLSSTPEGWMDQVMPMGGQYNIWKQRAVCHTV